MIFSGRAYKYPDASYVNIDVTDISHDLVSPCFIDSSTGHVDNSETIKSCTLYGNTTVSYSVRYWNRFDEAVPQSSYLYNDPAGRTVDPGSWLYPYSNGGVQIYHNGTLKYSSIGGSTKIDLSNYGLKNGDKLELRGPSKSIFYKVKCGAKYELFYQNTRGALDSIVFYGPCTMRGTTTRYSVHNVGEYGPSLNYKFINENKANEGRLGWSLVTGPMRDEESANIYEVVFSNQCWLHDLDNDSIYAVNITNSDIEQKQRKKDKGNTSYTINVELARNIISKN